MINKLRAIALRVGFVEGAELGSAFLPPPAPPGACTPRSARLCRNRTISFGQAVGNVRIVASRDHLRQIDHRVPRHGKRNFRLFDAHVIHSGDDQGAGVEDRGQRAEPGLIVVLRAKKTQGGIGEMAL